MITTSRIVTLFFVGLILSTCGCSSFNREWEEFPAMGKDSPAGRWVGRWNSQVNGHEGDLRCMISPAEKDMYEAKFEASYGPALTFRYSMSFSATREDRSWILEGEEDLGLLAGGIYRYRGTVDLTDFVATYSSAKDMGTYRMTRFLEEKVAAAEEEEHE